VRHFVPDDKSTQRGRRHAIHAQVHEFRRPAPAQFAPHIWILQHLRHWTYVALCSRRQLKMPLTDRAYVFQIRIMVPPHRPPSLSAPHVNVKNDARERGANVEPYPLTLGSSHVNTRVRSIAVPLGGLGSRRRCFAAGGCRRLGARQISFAPSAGLLRPKFEDCGVYPSCFIR